MGSVFGGARLPNGQIAVAKCPMIFIHLRYLAIKRADLSDVASISHQSCNHKRSAKSEPGLSWATARRVWRPCSSIIDVFAGILGRMIWLFGSLAPPKTQPIPPSS
jgi:hypothetical protein